MIICHVNLARGFRGGERQTQLLIEELAERGLEQILIAREDSPLHINLKGVRGLRLQPISKPYAKNIWLLRHMKIDLVHAHEAKAAQWALLNYWFRKTPYIMTRRISRRSKDLTFTRAVYRNAAVVVALSTAVKESVQQLIPRKDVVVIPSMFASLPVNPQYLDQLRAQYSGRFVIGHIGALVNPHKGQAVLIKAARELGKKYPHMVFVLVGNGPDEAMLKRMAAAADNIEFIGFVDDVGTWINVFDLFVFPSLEEGLGSTLLDVMQHGKPIVASAVGGILDIIENRRNGLLVPANQPVPLAEALEELYLNPELRAKYAAAGKQGIERYSPRHIAECYHRVYDSLINRLADDS